MERSAPNTRLTTTPPLDLDLTVLHQFLLQKDTDMAYSAASQSPIVNTVWEGCRQQGTSANRPTHRAPHGFRYYDDTIREILVRDLNYQQWFSASGRMLYSAAGPRMLADDFRVATLDTRYLSAKGSNASAALPAIVAGKAEGRVQLTTGAAGDTVAHDGCAISGPGLDYVANALIGTSGYPGQAIPANGVSSAYPGIVAEASLQISAVSAVAFWFGLCDTLPTTTLMMPHTLTVATLTGNTVNAVGLLFDTAATTKNFWCVSTNTSVNTAQVNSTVAPVGATDIVLTVAVAPNGTATFYVNGVLVGTIAAAVAVGATLCPLIVATARTTTSETVLVDLLSCR